MHHAHVKRNRKEPPVNRYIVDEFHRDPALRRRLFAHATAERNRALRAGLGWLAARLRAIVPSRLSLPRWTERLG
jgi:hypothetical protein